MTDERKIDIIVVVTAYTLLALFILDKVIS